MEKYFKDGIVLTESNKDRDRKRGEVREGVRGEVRRGSNRMGIKRMVRIFSSPHFYLFHETKYTEDIYMRFQRWLPGKLKILLYQMDKHFEIVLRCPQFYSIWYSKGSNFLSLSVQRLLKKAWPM